MTLEQTLFMLREWRELNRADAIIRADDQAPEWCRSVLRAIADRLLWSRYLLTLADPFVLATAEDLLNAEILNTPSLEPSTPAPLIAAAVPGSARIH